MKPTGHGFIGGRYFTTYHSAYYPIGLLRPCSLILYPLHCIVAVIAVR